LRGMIAALLLAANLAADLQRVANIPGEPSLVSAAGIGADDQPILTLENATAFDGSTNRRRVVVRGPAAIDVVRWFKTKAANRLRRDWAVAALPSTEATEEPWLQRWLAFQAADLVLVIDGSDRDPIRTFRAALDRAPRMHSSARLTIQRRVSRDPIAIATLLAPKYPGTPAISYIPSIAWSNTIALARRTNDPSLRAKVEAQTQPWREGKDLFGNRIQLTSVAGTFVFAELGAHDVVMKGVEAASKVKDGDVYEYGQGWTDDMFMATVVLARNGKVDLASRMLMAYASRLQRPDGVFNHATNGPVAWGRGNGF